MLSCRLPRHTTPLPSRHLPLLLHSPVSLLFPIEPEGSGCGGEAMVPSLFLLLLVAGAAAQGHDGAVARRTMEEFAGVPASDVGEGYRAYLLRVDSEGLQRQIDELASFSDSPAPSVTRVLLYSDKDVQARRYIKGIMKELGLAVREDDVGNIFGRWQI